MDENIKWVNLSRQEIAKLITAEGIPVGSKTVKYLLNKHKFVKRKIQRKRSTGKFANRDKQFKHIKSKIENYTENSIPVISIDTKKKENIGNLHRNGSVYCTDTIETYDHDFQHLSEGKLVPHGIYDITNNKGHITLGVSSETADFICDCIEAWWTERGSNDWPNAKEILILCDAGGANSYRHHVFKNSLEALANRINLTINISHYPPYTSKWNPIEHRLFPHVSRALEGQPIYNTDQACNRISHAKTKTGLRTTVNVIKKIYETGKKLTKDVIGNIKYYTDAVIPELNYKFIPNRICQS